MTIAELKGRLVFTCLGKSIFVLSLVCRQFLIFASGKTNAALPINTNANNVELTAIDVPALNCKVWKTC